VKIWRKRRGARDLIGPAAFVLRKRRREIRRVYLNISTLGLNRLTTRVSLLKFEKSSTNLNNPQVPWL